MSQDRRTRQISYRLTEAEFLPLQAVAQGSGMRVNELCRRLAIQNKQAIPEPACGQIDPAVIKRLDRVGWNLNQLVKNAHVFKTVPPAAAELCEEIRTLVKAAVLERVKE